MTLGLYYPKPEAPAKRRASKKASFARCAAVPAVELIDTETGEVLGYPTAAEVRGSRRHIDVTSLYDDGPWRVEHCLPLTTTVHLTFTVGQNIALIA